MIDHLRKQQTIAPRKHPNSTRIRAWTLAAIAALATGAGASGLEGFTGEWNLDPSRSDRIDDAIETCIAGYPEEAKASTRERLEETNRLASTLFIASKDSGRKILIGYDEAGNGDVAPLDGTMVPVAGATGEGFEMRVALAKDSLVESFQADNGTRTNTYTVEPDGSTLVVRVVVESPYMPTILTYKLAYSRASNAVSPGKRAHRPGLDETGAALRGLDGRLFQNLSARKLSQVVVRP